MRKLVILYPAHYEQIMGGAELQISYLTKYAKLGGFETHFIYEDSGKPISNLDNLYLHPLIKINAPGVFGHRWYLYKKIINKKLDEIEPEVIYTRLGSSWTGIAALYARKNGIKHVHALSSDRDVMMKASIKNLLRPLDFLDCIYMNKGLKNADKVIVQNEFQRNTLFYRFGRTGVLINQMTPSINEGKIKKKNDIIQVLWIGNFKSIKRPELFIELSKRLGELKIKYRLIMIGRLPQIYQEILSNALSKYPWLSYRGELSQEQVNALLCESHILVNTSEYEGFSNTFVQAWMRKVPVVSMNSNPNELITKNNLGFIAPDMWKLTKIVKTLIEDHSLREKMGNGAFHYAFENHSVEKTIGKVLLEL